MTFVAPLRNIKELVTVRRLRTLPAEGEVLPVLSDSVRVRDVVAHSTFSNEHILLDAGPALGMAPKRAAQFLQREVGEHVEKGSILAGRQGFAARLLRSPVDGQIAAIRGSQILIQAQESSAKLFARIPGRVIEIIPNRGVLIQFVGSWIEGLWGNDEFDDGSLHSFSEDPAYTFTADDLDISLRSSILLAGHCNQRKALEVAQQIPIRGLILGSLDTRLLPIAQSMEYPILLTEGFGAIPMNGPAFKLLNSYAGQEIGLNAQIADEYAGLRPEVFIPINNAGEPPAAVENQSFRVGLRVRVLSNPYQGQVGEISALLPSSTLFPSGIRAAAAEVALRQGGAAVLPLANLEVLG